MTRDETLAVLAVLKAAYPSFYRTMSRKDADAVVDLWTRMFADDPVDLVALAVKAHIASDGQGFPPHIGAIKTAIVKLVSPDALTEMEAWAMVRKAISNGYYGSEAEFAKLPPEIQRIVGSPNQLRAWGTMDEDEVDTVVASNFQRSYRARVAADREMQMLPSDVRQQIQRLSDGFSAERAFLGEGST